MAKIYVLYLRIESNVDAIDLQDQWAPLNIFTQMCIRNYRLIAFFSLGLPLRDTKRSLSEVQ